MRVSLITTGEMEFRGLANALQRLFPAHVFDVEPDMPGKPFNGFTSCRVQPLTSQDPPGHAVRMLRAALGTVVRANANTPPSNLAIVIDDLEIVNKANEAVLLDHVRESARRIIGSVGPAIDPAVVAKRLREQISFHLAAPMMESWFFGDFSALQTEVPAAHWPPSIAAHRDPEDFLTADPNYEYDVGAGCTASIAKGKRPYWIRPDRKEHPKAYMKWLLRNPTLTDCTSYKEGKEGVRLMEQFNWSTVLATPTWFTYLRALVRDLESALGPAAFSIPAGGNEAPWTSISQSRSNAILRNL